MARLLILIHGMGANPPGWSADIRKKLDEVAARYAAFSDGAPSFSSQLIVEEVRYDQIFDHYVETWQQSADAFETFVGDQNKQLPAGSQWKPARLVSWLGDATLPDDEKSAFWSTGLDPVLYRGTPLVRDDVRTLVTQQIIKLITTHNVQGDLPVSVLAHSMGTMIAHDVLQQLASGATGGNTAFTARRWHFDNLFMLANVCVLGPPGLIDLSPKAKSGYFVRPKSAAPVGEPSPTWYANRIYSFRHEWDPFVRWAPFLPAKWGFDWGADFVSPEPLRHVHAANVHGFTHYLDHPAVHVPIINRSLGFSAITPKEAIDAVANYPAIGSAQCSAEIDKLRAIVGAFPEACDDLPTLAVATARFFGSAKRAALACKDLAGDL